MPWAKDKDRIKANYKKLVEYKKKIRCEHCGVRDHRIIDFHHTRPIVTGKLILNVMEIIT